MSNGNANGALKLLTENMSNEQKLTKANEPSSEILLQGPIRPVHPTVYEDMDVPHFKSSNANKRGI